MQARPHDIALFGATGFTGALAAEYLARHAPPQTRWALAGRDLDKLAALQERLPTDTPSPLIRADVGDRPSLEELARSARVVISTVGPYIEHGEPLVAACAAAGTDYVDISGEPEFVDLVYVRHHAAAQLSGARLVHCCGFDSIPTDLGVLFTVQQLPEGQPLRVEGFVSARGRASAGTLATVMTGLSRPRSFVQTARARRLLEERPDGRRVRGVAGSPHRVPGVGWVLPMPTVDPQIALRSARALERYGPEFSYSHYFAAGSLPVALATAGVVGSLFGVAQVPPARRAALARLTASPGPPPEVRARSWFKLRFDGRAGDGQRVVTEVAGGDPGYEETAKMLCQSALCLAHDELPQRSGQLTTAVAMGDALRARLEGAGISFARIQ